MPATIWTMIQISIKQVIIWKQWFTFNSGFRLFEVFLALKEKRQKNLTISLGNVIKSLEFKRNRFQSPQIEACVDREKYDLLSGCSLGQISESISRKKTICHSK